MALWCKYSTDDEGNERKEDEEEHDRQHCQAWRHMMNIIINSNYTLCPIFHVHVIIYVEIALTFE